MTPQLLNNRYRIIRVLGAGGFGETFLAEDTQMPSKRRCVIKQLKPITNNPQIYQLVQERFQREAAILEELGGKSQQIPTLYAYFQTSGQFYLVQEWIEGETLTTKLQKHGLLSESAVQEILVNLLPALDYVHSQRIVHRDLKPDNIILRYSDGKPVLIDFGAVRESMGTVVNSQGNPTSSIVIGTPGYMPSEQAAGRPVYSSDLYSLGLTAIYLLTGRQPQQLETDSYSGEILWHQYASNISPTMAAVIDQAIKYHPRDRYPTARAMLDALQAHATFPPTVPSFKPSTTNPQTIPLTTPSIAASSNQKGMIIGSAIAGGLIGASVIIGLVLTKSSQPIAQQTVSPSVTPPIATPEVTKTAIPKPVVTPSTAIPKVTKTALLKPTPTKQSIYTSSLPSSTTSTPPVATTNVNDYFWLSQRLVTDADLHGKDGYELDIMRNWVFAIHGRRFDTPGLQEYFNNQPWYRPLYAPKEFSTKLLSNLERQNIEYISKYQDRNNRRYFKK